MIVTFVEGGEDSEGEAAEQVVDDCFVGVLHRLCSMLGSGSAVLWTVDGASFVNLYCVHILIRIIFLYY